MEPKQAKIPKLGSDSNLNGSDLKVEDVEIDEEKEVKILKELLELKNDACEQLEWMVEQKKEENAKLQSEKDILSLENVRLKNELQDLASSGDAGAVISKLKNELNGIKVELLTVKTEKEKITTELNEKISTLTEQYKQVQEDNDNLIERITETFEKKREQASAEKPMLRQNIMFLTDQNGKIIMDHLKNIDHQKWSAPMLVYTTEDITIQTTSKRWAGDVRATDIYVILVGPTQVRKGEKAEDVLKLLKTAVTILAQDKPVIVLELPPFKTDRRKNMEVKILNEALKGLPNLSENITFVDWRNKVDHVPADDLVEGDYTLKKDGEGTKKIASILKDIVTKFAIEAAANMITSQVVVPGSRAGLVIGKQRKNLEKWLNTYKAKIDVGKEDDPVMTVTGPKEGVESVIKEIMNLVTNAERKDEMEMMQHHEAAAPMFYTDYTPPTIMRPPPVRREGPPPPVFEPPPPKRRENVVPCIHFKKGYCKNGDSCTFLHSDEGGSGLMPLAPAIMSLMGGDRHEAEKRDHRGHLLPDPMGSRSRPDSYSTRDSRGGRDSSRDGSRSRSDRSRSPARRGRFEEDRRMDTRYDY